jgi:hypothetical protein
MGCGKFCTRHNNAIHLAIKYDVKEVIPFLMTILYQLNPIVDAVVTPCDELAF